MAEGRWEGNACNVGDGGSSGGVGLGEGRRWAATRLTRERHGRRHVVAVAHLDVGHPLAARGVAVVDDANVQDGASLRERRIAMLRGWLGLREGTAGEGEWVCDEWRQARGRGWLRARLGEELKDVAFIRLGGEVVGKHGAGVALELFKLPLPLENLSLLLLAQPAMGGRRKVEPETGEPEVQETDPSGLQHAERTARAPFPRASGAAAFPAPWWKQGTRSSQVSGPNAISHTQS